MAIAWRWRFGVRCAAAAGPMRRMAVGSLLAQADAAAPQPAAKADHVATEDNRFPAGETMQLAAPVKRTRAEVDALIDKLGKTPPDWWDSTQLRYPKTLDLTRWEAPPNSKWDQNRTIGQFFWSTINENPSRWKEGCRFAHFLMTHFKDDKPNLAKAMNQAAHIYGTLLGDYARSAFWYRKAAAITPLRYHQQIQLAECYWKLGCKPMALEAVNRMRSYGVPTIKLLSDMGELPKALDVAKQLAADYPDEAYLAAGDACRFNGKYKEALDYYQRIQSLPKPADQRCADVPDPQPEAGRRQRRGRPPLRHARPAEDPRRQVRRREPRLRRHGQGGSDGPVRADRGRCRRRAQGEAVFHRPGRPAATDHCQAVGQGDRHDHVRHDHRRGGRQRDGQGPGLGDEVERGSREAALVRVIARPNESGRKAAGEARAELGRLSASPVAPSGLLPPVRVALLLRRLALRLR